MPPAGLIMLGLGAAALVAGLWLLAASRRGSDPQRYARRIAGTMLAALGASLAIFAIGLAEPAHA